MKAIVNVDENWGIGQEGDQPFYIPEDLQFFKQKTMHKVVVMGSKTLLALPNASPLKHRTNIVLTTQKNLVVPGAIVVYDVQHLLSTLNNYNPDDVFVIGGAQIYKTLLSHCHKAYVTKIFAKANCDRFFPNLDNMHNWQLTSTSQTKTHQNLKFCFCEYSELN